MLTNKELMLIQDNVKACQTISNFLAVCAQSTSDTQLKNMCQTMASDHQRDMQKLTNYITNPNVQ